MWFKWIVCNVEEQQREAFSSAQEQWSTMAGQPGQLGQFGGWDVAQRDCGGILSLWENQKTLEEFMAPGGLHDQIYANNQQSELMSGCKVSLFHEFFPMPGAFPSLRAAARKAQWLRVAYCRVADPQYLNFLEAQRKIWSPGMRAAPGMLGGSFAGDGTDGFLIASLWSSKENHDHYCTDILPDLRLKVLEMDGFADSVVGYSIELEPRWNIV